MRLLIVILVMIPGVAAASTTESQVLVDMCEFAARMARWLVGAGYVISATTLVRFAGSAAFMGRFPAPNFLTWAAALFVLSTIPMIIAYVINGSFGFDCPTFSG